MNQQRFPTIIRIARWCVRVARRVGFGLLVLFVLVAIPWTYFNIKWGRELEAELVELKAQGMPLTLAEAAPKDVPDEQNAAVLYQQVFGEFFPGVQREARRIGAMTGDEQGVIRQYIKTNDAALQGQAREILSRPAVKRDLEIIRRASQRPHCVFPVNWEDGVGALLPHLPPLRDAVRVLAAQALISAEAGRLDEALDWCCVSLRMSEHVAAEPTLIAQLLAIAVQGTTLDVVERLISEQQLEPGVANDFADYLSRIDLRKAFTKGMIGERALGIQSFHSPLWKLDELTYIDYMSRLVAAHRLPYSNAVAEIESANKELNALPFYQGILAKMLVPVFARVVDKRAEATANIGLCRAVLALKAYKYDHGAYPETLDQLEETLDWQLPEDPFSGKDFVYQRQAEGFKLYSIGQDLKDSGGEPRDESRPYYDPDRDFDIVWQCSS